MTADGLTVAAIATARRILRDDDAALNVVAEAITTLTVEQGSASDADLRPLIIPLNS